MSENKHIDPLALRDITELNDKITRILLGQIDEEKFRQYRLTRGVYGQRQQGVQMVRIKLPFGSITPQGLVRIADIADKYASGNLHATTRQDIQIHYVKLINTPQIWTELEEEGITLREACGNTVRNITASSMAGIDPEEPFDVTPYAYAVFKYFLRNPICQELGRTFKIAFSSSQKDTAYTFVHDLGFIPKVKYEDGEKKLGFKVMLAGGLGAQPFHAHVAYDFLPEEKLIPFIEAVLRVFDRYGERVRRHKARIKYLVNDIGLEEFLKLVEEEKIALKNKVFKVDTTQLPPLNIPDTQTIDSEEPLNKAEFELWKKTNVFKQKQDGFYAVGIRLTNGDMKSDTARSFAAIAQKYAASDIRITVNQGYLLKYVREHVLGNLYNELAAIGLARPGFDSIHDIVACPGTDTCNLGIASSMGLAVQLEKVLSEEYADLISENNIKIKISGCMNACGQHSVANIGFHGMSLKVGEHVLPAHQVMLGGGIVGDGKGIIAEKIIKLPSKRIPDALRILLNDYENNAIEGEYFNDYFIRQGKNYFYQLLKPLSIVQQVTQDMMIDWGDEHKYETAVGIGECAGVIRDLVSLVLEEQPERLALAREAFQEKNWADGIYHCYNVFIQTAKALLLTKDIQCNTQHGIIHDLDKYFVQTGEIHIDGSFKDQVLLINKNEPNEVFAREYYQKAEAFYKMATNLRTSSLVKV